MVHKQSRPSLESLEDRTVPARVPVLVVPGIAGSSPANPLTEQFLFNRGVPPTTLQLDPIDNTYTPLVNALKAQGYVEGVDLFAAPYDWRLSNAPADSTHDGHIPSLTAASLTDSVFEYGVDYMGFWLDQAVQAWAKAHPGVPLTEVDVIAHSMGNLVTRSYIQSDAYGGTYTGVGGQTFQLPTVRNYFMVAAPTLGASSAWNLANDNAIINAFDQLLASVLHAVYENVRDNGVVIGGPTPISRASITNVFTNQPDPQLFLDQYLPTLTEIIGTYNFLNVGTAMNPVFVNVNSQTRHSELLLDLNGGADPDSFAGQVDQLRSIFGTNVSTATTAIRVVDPPQGMVFSVGTGMATPTVPGQVYFVDNITAAMGATPVGDGTVPIQSLLPASFLNDPRITLVPFTNGVNTTGDVSHDGLLSNTDFLALITATLKAAPNATAPPSLERLLVNNVSNRAAPVRQITLLFDQPLSIKRGAFRLVGPRGQRIAVRVRTTFVNNMTQVRLRFPGLRRGTLPTGIYSLRIRGMEMVNSLGDLLSTNVIRRRIASVFRVG